MNNPISPFSRALSAATGAVVAQVSRQPAFRNRMTAAALALATGVAMSLTAAPQVHAQTNNTVQRVATDVIGGVIGGAIGSRIGGGSGKKAATVAGVAAGVLAAEAIQDQGGSPQLNDVGRYGQGAMQPAGWGNMGPTIAPGWGDVRVPGTGQQAARGVLQSGATPLSGQRSQQLAGIERDFLMARDQYARSIFNAEQAQDDLSLAPGSVTQQQTMKALGAQTRAAEQDYARARQSFVEAVEHLGRRGYDVHQFAYSHKLAYSRVSSNDLSRNDMQRVLSSRNTMQEAEVRADTFSDVSRF